jgi:hypothetical protein
MGFQLAQKIRGSRDGGLFVHQDAVHVDEPRQRWGPSGAPDPRRPS